DAVNSTGFLDDDGNFIACLKPTILSQQIIEGINRLVHRSMAKKVFNTDGSSIPSGSTSLSPQV
ncbi:MAG: hypothetical protein J5U19_09890, partial [Candidatus Methanoperedens sp.]|nr:hypothetical protein [Candidatus Methanoperedens sp.]